MDDVLIPTIAEATAVRHAIAAAVLDVPVVRSRIGRITLRERQTWAASRLTALIRDDGGALLAEPVGLGKTYTAIAVARTLGEAFVVVAPAALVPMWQSALVDCEVAAPVISHESLSRGLAPPAAPLIVVDESHRFRTPSTRRYARLADACRRAPTLLVSATPIHNRTADLAAQLALFLGRRAWTMTDADLARHVVRCIDDAESARSLPRQDGPTTLSLAADDDCLALILGLPPPIPAKDESTAAALLTYGLLHQWSSSRAALVEALRRRRARGLAMLDALRAGRIPTRIELAAWTHASDAMQLAFPELVVAATDSDLERDALALGVERHLEGVDALLRACRRAPDPDDARAEALRSICARHAGERVIAFCHYAETVAALRRRLGDMPGVAALTARGAVIASGRVPRADALAQFAPRGDRPDVRPADRITLLVTTDLLSEGVNLQEASVVVHLDLPWNPARLEQRVGRVRRFGSRFDRISVYCFAPPTGADNLLRIEARLRRKLALAQRTVGVAGSVLPSFTSAPRDTGLAESIAHVDRVLHRWISPNAGMAKRPAVAAVRSTSPGFVAAIAHGDDVALVADVNGSIGESAEHLALAVDLADGDALPVDPLAMQRAFARLARYLDERRGRAALDIGAIGGARSRRDALNRVSRALARAPRHRRAQLAPLVDAARSAASTPLGEGAERVLEQLVRAELPDDAWLRAIAAFGQLYARPGSRDAASVAPSAAPVIVAVLLLQN